VEVIHCTAAIKTPTAEITRIGQRPHQRQEFEVNYSPEAVSRYSEVASYINNMYGRRYAVVFLKAWLVEYIYRPPSAWEKSQTGDNAKYDVILGVWVLPDTIY
jgi:hypothetical protein